MYLPEINWETQVWGVVKIDATHYECTVHPTNPNEPGAAAADITVGSCYLMDYVGHFYTITQVVSGTLTKVIRVNDDFLENIGPQQGRSAYVYKSVGGGYAPYVSPVNFRRLDTSAIDYASPIEKDVLWKHRGVRVGTEDNVTKVTLEGLSMKDVVAGWAGGKGVTLYPNPINHNDQPGLQGIGTDYYHLSYDQYRGVSAGSTGYLPRYNVAGWLENSKFTDDGTTPKYNTNTIWHSGNDGLGSGLDADLFQGNNFVGVGNNWGGITHISDDGVMEVGKYIDFHNTDGAITDYDNRLVSDTFGSLLLNGKTIWNAGNSNLSTVDWTAKDFVAATAKIGTLATGLAPLVVSHSGTQLNQMTLGSDSGITASFERLNERYGLYIGTSGDGYSWMQAGRVDTATAYDLWLQASGGNVRIGTLAGYLKGTAGVVGAVSSIPESDISFTDITTGNASTAKHGFLSKLPNVANQFANGVGGWTTLNPYTGLPTFVVTDWTTFAAAVTSCNNAGGGNIKINGTVSVPSSNYISLSNILVENGNINTPAGELVVSSDVDFRNVNFNSGGLNNTNRIIRVEGAVAKFDKCSFQNVYTASAYNTSAYMLKMDNNQSNTAVYMSECRMAWTDINKTAYIGLNIIGSSPPNLYVSVNNMGIPYQGNSEFYGHGDKVYLYGTAASGYNTISIDGSVNFNTNFTSYTISNGGKGLNNITTTLTFSESEKWGDFSSIVVNGRREGKTNVIFMSFYSANSSSGTDRILGRITNYISPGYSVMVNVNTPSGLSENATGYIDINGYIILRIGKSETTYNAQATWITA